MGNLLRSTLLKVLNQGKFGDVPNQLNRWVNGGTPPRPMPGLVRRRREEGKLWTAGDVSGAGKGPPARTPGRPSADIYTVVSGDTLGTIARKFGVRVDEIVKANGIVDRNVIQVGQKIIIPKGKTAKRKTPKPKAARPKRGDGKRPAPRPRVYTVVSGDNLTKIARCFGTTVPAIVKANAIANPDLIRVGQRLTIR